MTQAYIKHLKSKVISLHSDLMIYEHQCLNDSHREGTGKVYPENVDDHKLLDQTLEALATCINNIRDNVNKLI